MKFWLDCEFNGFGGDFISAALTSDNRDEWYQSTYCIHPVHWVKQNVIPVLYIEPISLDSLQSSLQQFLNRYNQLTIVADWPADIEYFCWLMSSQRMDGTIMRSPPITFELKTILNGRGESETPHNALSDARALMKEDLKQLVTNVDFSINK